MHRFLNSLLLRPRDLFTPVYICTKPGSGDGCAFGPAGAEVAAQMSVDMKLRTSDAIAQAEVSSKPGAAHCKAFGTFVLNILSRCHSQHTAFIPAGAHMPDWKGLYQI